MGKLIFHAFHRIAHLPCKYVHFRERGGGGVCISVIGTGPIKPTISQKTKKTEKNDLFNRVRTLAFCEGGRKVGRGMGGLCMSLTMTGHQ